MTPAPLLSGQMPPGALSPSNVKSQSRLRSATAPLASPMNTSVKIRCDVYSQKADPTLRIAVAPGAGLPTAFKVKDWIRMPNGKSRLHSDVSMDIADKGYCYFQISKDR